MYKEELRPRFKKEFALESANFIAKNNMLRFDSEFYLHAKRIAICAIFAPTSANLTDIMKLKFTLLSARVTL